MPKAARKRKTYASDAGTASARSSNNSRAAAVSSAGPSARSVRAGKPKAGAKDDQGAFFQILQYSSLVLTPCNTGTGRQSQAAKEVAKAKRQAKTLAAKEAAKAGKTAASTLNPAAAEIVVAAPPDFPILDAPTSQTPTATVQLQTADNPPSPSIAPTEVVTSPPRPVASVPENSRALARQGAVVLDSSIDPHLLSLSLSPSSSSVPIASAADVEPAAPGPAIDSTSTDSAAKGSSAPQSGAGKGKRRARALSEESVKEVKVKVPQPKDWSDPHTTLAYIQYKRVKITSQNKRTNQLKKTYFKMRRDAMTLETQTGAFVGLFVCKAHKNRDDDHHAYNFHFSDTIIHNEVLVELATTLKRDVKMHMQAIWAKGVGKGESALIIQQRKQLAEANVVAGTLRAQAEVAKNQNNGQAKEIQRQEKAMKKQLEKVAAMKAKLRAAGVVSDSQEEDSDSSDSSDSDDSDDSVGSD
ncbi:hypothetical protein P7C70_g7610, partial [Phenoliferia sp. Uapishka_3]